jgi:hypothetical protein
VSKIALPEHVGVNRNHTSLLADELPHVAVAYGVGVAASVHPV